MRRKNNWSINGSDILGKGGIIFIHILFVLFLQLNRSGGGYFDDNRYKLFNGGCGLMVLLDSVLAFTLIMGALAGVVTLLMEMIHRLLNFRARGMAVLFDHFYSDVLANRLGVEDENRVKEIKDEILKNRSRHMMVSAEKWLHRWLTGWWLPRWLSDKIIIALTSCDKIDTDDMLLRISRLKEFKAFSIKAGERLESSLEELEEKYDEYSLAMTEYFRRRAQLMSLLVGVLLAFSVNIDGVKLFDELLKNSDMRASYISQQESLEKSFAETQKRIETFEKTGKDLSNKEQIEALNQNMTLIQNQLSDFNTSSLPIGWEDFPEKGDPFPVRDEEAGIISSYLGWFVDCLGWAWEQKVWVFKVLITGLLIGLGAPFWFEVAQKLSQTRQVFKGKENDVDTQSANAAQQPTQSQNGKSTIQRIIESNKPAEVSDGN